MDHIVQIDPLALLLRNDIYVKLTLPDPPHVDVLKSQICELVRTMGHEEKKLALSRAKALSVFANAMEKEISKGLKSISS